MFLFTYPRLTWIKTYSRQCCHGLLLKWLTKWCQDDENEDPVDKDQEGHEEQVAVGDDNKDKTDGEVVVEGLKTKTRCFQTADFLSKGYEEKDRR